MKKAIVATIVAAAVALSACGRELHTEKKTYPTYGILNEGSLRSQHVCYSVSVGNVIWSIILIETVIAPIYFVGFSLFNPTRLKTGPNDNCNNIDGPGA